MINVIIDQLADFQCIAADCPFTCCAGWGVIVDEETDAYYRTVPGEFGAFLNESIDRSSQPSKMKMTEGKCAFLTPEHLCRIQLNLGEEHLCTVCTYYPRLSGQYGPYRFLYTTASCPEVSRELLSRTDPLLIVSSGEPEEKEDPTPDEILTDLAYEGFGVGIDLLQNRALSIAQRQKLFLMMNRALQSSLDAGKYVEAGAVVSLFSDPAQYAQFLSPDVPESSSKLILLRTLLRRIAVEPLEERFSHSLAALEAQEEAAWGASVSEYLKQYQTELATEQEQELVYLMFGHYMRKNDEGWSPYQNAVLILTINQLQRTMTALASAEAGALTSLEERVMNFALISRAFEHSIKGVNAFIFRLLEKQGLTEPELMFRLVS